MSLIKSRNWTKKEDEDLLAVLQKLKNQNVHATWNQIAELIKQRNQQCLKTGKQCRQRWANQLDPKIKRSQTWSKEQNQTLFKLHFQLGNKWSQICSHIPGRTDNCVKNHFYSTMRRGLRKVNSYLENVKRKTILTKTFKIQILNKILAICEGKNDDKFQFNEKAKQYALSIKQKLIKLSLQLSDIDQQDVQFKQKIFNQILEFSRNCRKKKKKKSNEMSDEQFNCEVKHPKNIQQSIQKQQIYEQCIQKNQKISITSKNKQVEKNELVICQQKPIQVPLIIQNNMYQGHNRKPENIIFPKIHQVNIITPPQRQQNLCRSNNFSFFCPQGQVFGFINFNQNIQENNQQNQNDKKQGFLSKLPDLSKIKRNQQEEKPQKNEAGVFYFNDFINIHQFQQKNNQYSNIVQSQDLQNPPEFQNIGFPFAGMPIFTRQNTTGGYTLPSPLFSPFSLYGEQRGFNFVNNWATQSAQSEKFKSTKYDINFQEKSKNVEKVIQNGSNSQSSVQKQLQKK